MKKLLLGLLVIFAFTSAFSQVVGVWKMSPQAAALGVGPELGNISWWSNSAGDVITRACYFDDEYVFEDDGTFSNVLGDETWIEPWQGMNPEACGAPVYPHDGSNAATWTYDATAGTITLDGVGAYLGLPKVYNGGELTSPDDAPQSISYPVEFNATGDTMEINISIGSGYWRFILTTNADPPPPPASISLPVTFDDDQLDYSLTDFGGNASMIMTDPTNPDNMVVQSIKSETAETWAGTTVSEPYGLDPIPPFEEGSTVMSMRVFSPEADLPILFKLEVWDNTGVYTEVTSNTTMANEWETIYFDFSDDPTFDMANPYNKPVIFFNFGVSGAEAGELTFLWDDIEFYDTTSGIKTHKLELMTNPVIDVLHLKNVTNVESIFVYNLMGQSFPVDKIGENKYDFSGLNKGIYTVLILEADGKRIVGKVLKH